jgi:hypothetical protein
MHLLQMQPPSMQFENIFHQKYSNTSCTKSKRRYNDQVSTMLTDSNTDTTNMKTEQNTHFTAAMLFNSDKAQVQELRNTHELGEKEMMRVILKVVLHNGDLLNAEVDAFKASIEAERQAVKQAREAEKEAAKAAKQAERAAAKAAKEAAKAAKQAEREAAKAAKQAEREAAKEDAKEAVKEDVKEVELPAAE